MDVDSIGHWKIWFSKIIQAQTTLDETEKHANRLRETSER